MPTNDEVTAYVEDQLADYATEQYVEDSVAACAQISDLADFARVVDGVSASNGAVDFNLDPNEWVKTDSNGHLATTSETPVSLSAGDTGYLYASNGALQFKADDYVTLSTAQTITAPKTFVDANVILEDGGNVIVGNPSTTGSETRIAPAVIYLDGTPGQTGISFKDGTAANTGYLVKNS